MTTDVADLRKTSCKLKIAPVSCWKKNWGVRVKKKGKVENEVVLFRKKLEVTAKKCNCDPQVN